jgi:hypothetical protein
MASPAVSLISNKAPLGAEYVVHARLTWTTYAQAIAGAGVDVLTPASVGLLYINHVEVSQPEVLGTNVAWDRTQGTPGFIIFVDDIAGVSAEAAAAANTTVVDVIVFGI